MCVHTDIYHDDRDKRNLKDYIQLRYVYKSIKKLEVQAHIYI
jgi:hypothetical protein